MNTEMIVNELVRRGYNQVPQPLHVADLDFDFAAALMGPKDQESLTLVLDAEGQSFAAAQRRLQAFALVLDRSGSTRPLNVVVVAKHPDAKGLRALEESARVVVVDPDRPLEESLAPLFPLELPEPIAGSGSSEAALEKAIGNSPGLLSIRLIKAAQESAERVQLTMRRILHEASNEFE
jgi:hypothetical protein